MSPPLTFSVVIPAFNRGAEIQSAIQSALGQTFGQLEVIVVDDRSTDDTVEAASRVKDPRIRVLRREKNGGASAARNTGIGAAGGDFIAFLDSDDLWQANKLEKNYEFIRRHDLSATASWVAYNLTEVRTEFGSKTGASPPKPSTTRISELLLCNEVFIQTSAVFVPTAFAKAHPFSENVAWVDDWDFLLRLERAGAAFWFQDEVLSVHHAYSGVTRMSNKSNADALVAWIESQRPYLNPRELAGFYAHRVAPAMAQSGRRAAALAFLARGLAARSIGPRSFAIESARALLPGTAFQTLRRAARRPRG